MTKLDANGIPILSRTDIEERSESFIRHFDDDCLSTPQMTPLGAICTRLAGEYRVAFDFSDDLGSATDGYRIMGRFHPGSRTISIDASLVEGDPRFSFTLAHELGHLVLHCRIQPDLLVPNTEAIEDTRRQLTLERADSADPGSWIEWQANAFAASLLLPRLTVPLAVEDKQRAMGINRSLGRIYLDIQGGNRRDYRTIVDHLRYVYQTSRAVVKIRLRELNIVVEPSTRDLPGVASIGDALGDYMDTIKRRTRGEDP